jgi:hypothetical protein
VSTAPERPADGTRSELHTALVVGACVLAASPLLGVVWWLVAPLPVYRVFGDAYGPTSEGEAAVAADGWFAVCAATAGLSAALLVFGKVRRTRLGALLGLAVGGLLGAVVTWQVGELLGPGEAAETARRLADGTVFEGPLELGAKGVLFAWPMVSVIAYFGLTAGLEPSEPGTRFPVTVLREGYAIGEVNRFFTLVDAGTNPADPGEPRFSRVRMGRRYDGVSVDAAVDAWRRRAVTDPAETRPDESARPGPG